MASRADNSLNSRAKHNTIARASVPRQTPREGRGPCTPPKGRSVGRAVGRAGFLCGHSRVITSLFLSFYLYFSLSPFFYLLHSLFSSKGTPDNGLPRGAITASRSRLETGKQASRQALGHPHYRTRWRARALGHKRQGTAAAVAWWHCDGEVPRQH